MGDLFVIAIILLPILAVLLGPAKAFHRKSQWRRTAMRLGFQESGSYPELTMSGVWKGVQIELVHRVEYRYKQAPLIDFIARANLNSIDPHVGGSYRDAESSALVVFESAVVVGDWLEYEGAGEAPLERLEELFDTLARTARRVATAGE